MRTLLFWHRLPTNPDSSSADGATMISAISPRGRFLSSPSSPQTPATTNYFLLVTEMQSSEGRGIFCYCSYQDKFKSIPPVGHSLSWSLFLRPLIGDIGSLQEALIWFWTCKTATCWTSWVHFLALWELRQLCGWVLSFIVAQFNLHISGA